MPCTQNPQPEGYPTNTEKAVILNRPGSPWTRGAILTFSSPLESTEILISSVMGRMARKAAQGKMQISSVGICSRKNRRAGFTLLEIVLVIFIISLFARSEERRVGKE